MFLIRFINPNSHYVRTRSTAHILNAVVLCSTLAGPLPAMAGVAEDASTNLASAQAEYSSLLTEEASLRRQISDNTLLALKLDAFAQTHAQIMRDTASLKTKVKEAQAALQAAVRVESPDIDKLTVYVKALLEAINAGAVNPGIEIAKYNAIFDSTSACTSSSVIDQANKIGAYSSMIGTGLVARYESAMGLLPIDARFDAIRAQSMKALQAVKDSRDLIEKAATAADEYRDVHPMCKIFRGIYPILALYQTINEMKAQGVNLGTIDVASALNAVDSAEAAAAYSRDMRRLVKGAASQFNYWLTLNQVDKSARLASTLEEIVLYLLSRPAFSELLPTSDAEALKKECSQIVTDVQKTAQERLGDFSTVKAMIKNRMRAASVLASKLNSNATILQNSEWRDFLPELAAQGVLLTGGTVWPVTVIDLPAAFAFDVKIAGLEAKLDRFAKTVGGAP